MFLVPNLRTFCLCLTLDPEDFLLFFFLKVSQFCVSVRFRARFIYLFIAYGHLISLAPFVEKAMLPQLDCFCTLVKINWTYLCGSISEFSFLFHRSMCLPAIPHSLDYCNNSVSLEIKQIDCSQFILLFFKIVLAIQFLCLNIYILE